MRLPCFLAITLLPCFVSWATAQNPSAEFKTRDHTNDHRLTDDELRTSRRKLIKRIDTNGDGIITAAEDTAFFKNIGKATASSQIQRRLDINYAGTNNPRQTLDLFLPPAKPVNAPPESLPIIVWIHGGGWQNGNNNSGHRRLERYVRSGQYVGASIHYRLSREAQWPTQLHDCKAAIRWLMANTKLFGGKADKIIAMGSSAGGHLVSMLALTHGIPHLEGTVGPNRSTTAMVTAAVNFYGPTGHENEGAKERPERETTFRKAVECVSPIVEEVLEEFNRVFLESTGEVNWQGIESDGNEGIVSLWLLT